MRVAGRFKGNRRGTTVRAIRIGAVKFVVTSELISFSVEEPGSLKLKKFMMLGKTKTLSRPGNSLMTFLRLVSRLAISSTSIRKVSSPLSSDFREASLSTLQPAARTFFPWE